MSTYSIPISSQHPDQPLHKRLHAEDSFIDARKRADFGRIIGLLFGKRAMPSLSSRLAGRMVYGQQALGLRTVEIGRIVGSESRVDYFDRQFNPLSDAARERWVSIAALSLNDIGLPPVDLIQVGEEFFVRDGHHRISVARALGWAFIDARVTRLEFK